MNPTRLSLAALLLAALALVFVLIGSRRAPAGDGDWLRGTAPEQTKVLEKQLRGLDVAMFEIGYRFTELHFAGQDGNWDYARYHAEKIDLAMRLALERRPKRSKSSQPFLNEALPAVLRAIQAADREQFTQAMERLRISCMKCHTDEKVPYFTVELPEHRLAPIRTVR
jgi:hypothetical protein